MWWVIGFLLFAAYTVFMIHLTDRTPPHCPQCGQKAAQYWYCPSCNLDVRLSLGAADTDSERPRDEMYYRHRMGQLIVAHTGLGTQYATGTLVGYCDGPQVAIQTADGRYVWWHADLTEVLEEPEQDDPGTKEAKPALSCDSIAVQWNELTQFLDRYRRVDEPNMHVVRNLAFGHDLALQLKVSPTGNVASGEPIPTSCELRTGH